MFDHRRNTMEQNSESRIGHQSHKYVPNHHAMVKMQMHLELFSYIAETATWSKPAPAVAFGCLEHSA